MLWQQELCSTIYVDILKNTTHSTDFASLNNKKENNVSYVARTLGNKKYVEGDYKGAILLYNKGLCYAEKNSEFLSLCYCNRSMCFLQLGLHDKCLVDIRLAKSGNCPDGSLKKLGLREKKCLGMIQYSTTLTSLEMMTLKEYSSEKLDGVDGELPFISSGIIVEKSPQYGRMIVAKHDIQMGDTLVAEANYIRTEKSFDFNKCLTCSKLQMNFIPCEKCSGAMYCDELCEQKNLFHELECDMVLESDHCCDGLHLPFILRSIIVGINSFETIAQMMQCVAQWISTDPLEIIELTSSPISKYQAFFKLSTVKLHQVSRYRRTAYMIFNSAMQSTHFSSKFQTTAEQRFLAHLIVHHCGITQTNSFGESSASNGYNSISIDVISSYFNHSCVPNVTRLEKGSVTVIKAISPIRAGEQLFLTYLEAFDMNLHERQNRLETMYGFNCECKLCIDGVMTIRGLEDDSVFLQICTESSKVSLNNFDVDLILKVKALCIKFCMKYPNYITSRETNYVKDVFGECLRRMLIQY